MADIPNVTNRLDTGGDLRPREGFRQAVAVTGNPQAGNISVGSVNTQLMNDLAQWGGAAIRSEVAKNRNSDYIEGQMRRQQGRSFSEVETSGSKSMIDGYREADAYSVASALMVAQQQEIEESAYAMEPDEYLKQYGERSQKLLEGRSPEEQKLIMGVLTKQAPQLAQRQMQANVQYKQQRTFESAVNAIGVISKDSTSDAEFARLTDVDGDGPLSALGPEQRRQAIVAGVAASFQAGNPAAYIKLKSAGVIDKLTPDQQANVEQAHKQWQQTIRVTWNADRAKAMEEFQNKMDLSAADGGFRTPLEAAEEYAKMLGSWGVDMSAEEGMRTMTAAAAGISADQATDGMTARTAMISGDFSAATDIVGRALSNVESGGRYDATGPAVSRKDGSIDRAYGKYQIMGSNIPKWTEQAIGRRVSVEEFLNSPQIQEATFKHIFGGMLEKRGNIEDAVSEWHSGVSLREAEAQGRADVNMATTDYVKKVMGKMSGNSTAETRYKAAQAAYTAAVSNDEAQRTTDLLMQRADLDQRFLQGDLTKEAWLTSRNDLYTTHRIQQTAESATSALKVISDQRETFANPETRERFNAASLEIAQAQASMQSVIDNPSATPQARADAIQAYTIARNNIMDSYAIPVNLRQDSQAAGSVAAFYRDAMNKDRVQSEQAVGARFAAENGSLGSDTTVQPAARKAWWTSKLSEVQQQAQAAYPNKDAQSEQARNVHVQQGMLKAAADAGYFPPEMKAGYSAVLNSPMLNKEGMADSRAVSAVSDYLSMKQLNPRVAEMMLDESARANVEQILNMAGYDPTGIPYAIQLREGFNNSMATGTKSISEFISLPDTQEKVASAVHNALTPGFGQRVAMTLGIGDQTTWTSKTSDPTYRAAYTEAVESEVSRQYALTAGKGKADALVPLAIENVNRRMALLNGEPFMAPRGVDITAATFGNGAYAKAFSNAGDVNNAVKSYLYANRGTKGIPQQIGEYEGAAGFIAGPLLDIAQGGYSDPSTRVSYSPLYISNTESGAMLAVSLDVPGQAIPANVLIPLSEAGQQYITLKKNQAKE